MSSAEAHSSTAETARNLTGRIAAGVTALLFVGIGSIILLLLFAAGRTDDVARQASVDKVLASLSALRRHLDRTVTDYARWDDAMEKLHLSFDPEWAAINAGEYVVSTFRFDAVIVVSPANTVTYTYAVDETDSRNAILDTAKLFAIADLARSSEDAITGFITLGARPFAVAARRISYLDPAKPAPPGPPSVLIFAATVDDALLSEIRGDYDLPALKLQDTGKIPPHLVSVALPGILRGLPIGYVVWQPDLPGESLLRALAIPAGIALLSMAALLGSILANARRTGKALDAASIALKESRQTLEIQVIERTTALREAEARLRGIFEHAAEGIFQVSVDGRYVSANPAMARILGYASVGELLAFGHYWQVFAKLESEHEFRERIARTGEVRDFVCMALRRDGTPIWVSQNAHAVCDGSWAIVRYEGMIVDITDRKLAEDNLIHSALHDALTGLPNRELFFQRLAHALERSRGSDKPSFAVLMIDCDGFKLVNDSYGHFVGDRLLILLAQRLSACVRRGDALSRLGGDEFAVLVEDSSLPETALSLAERLQHACLAPFSIEGQQLFVTLSIGIATDNKGYVEPSEALRDADTAMYQAKARGRGRAATFDADMRLKVVARLQTETDIRAGLEANQFRMVYQPIVSLRTNHTVGFEALLRWDHPERGSVPPDEFIRIAEETGLILPLGAFAIRTTTRQLAEWLVYNPHLFVCVNLSPIQLAQADIVDSIANALIDARLAGSQLKLEVTESTLMTNAADIYRKLTVLTDLGVRLCIDDFGTGYSSLGQLSKHTFETLKIDRSFISRMGAGQQHLEIVRTILNLAENLRLSVVAEGVEKTLQSEWLRAHGCQFAQGHLFYKPLLAAEVPAMLRSQHSEGRGAGA